MSNPMLKPLNVKRHTPSAFHWRKKSTRQSPALTIPNGEKGRADLKYRRILSEQAMVHRAQALTYGENVHTVQTIHGHYRIKTFEIVKNEPQRATYESKSGLRHSDDRRLEDVS